jgi:DNA-binding CsgD family transcriptional regulator
MRYETACPFEVRFVLRLLAGLPPRQREVMAWTIDGYDPEEIAQLTGKNPATVRSHLRHARTSLKAALVQPTNEDAGKEAMRWASTRPSTRSSIQPPRPDSLS